MNLIRRYYQLFKILPDEERGRTAVTNLTATAVEEIFSPEQIKQYLIAPQNNTAVSQSNSYRIRESVVGGTQIHAKK